MLCSALPVWHLDCEASHGLPQVRMLNLVKMLSVFVILQLLILRKGLFMKSSRLFALPLLLNSYMDTDPVQASAALFLTK